MLASVLYFLYLGTEQCHICNNTDPIENKSQHSTHELVPCRGRGSMVRGSCKALLKCYRLVPCFIGMVLARFPEFTPSRFRNELGKMMFAFRQQARRKSGYMYLDQIKFAVLVCPPIAHTRSCMSCATLSYQNCNLFHCVFRLRHSSVPAAYASDVQA